MALEKNGTISEIRSKHPDWDLTLITDDLEHINNCASCGREVAYGQCYTSTRLFTDNGVFGLFVCTECYGKEPSGQAE